VTGKALSLVQYLGGQYRGPAGQCRIERTGHAPAQQCPRAGADQRTRVARRVRGTDAADADQRTIAGIAEAARFELERRDHAGDVQASLPS
jgi:hypothetical protein